MKYSKLTYYLLAILCMIATSCVTDGVMDDCSDNGKKGSVLIEGGRVNLILSLPAASTRGVTGEYDNGTEKERKINDVQIYTFVNGRFVEEVQYILISGVDGEATRYVEGKLSASYVNGAAMEFVIIANAKSKGVTGITINEGSSKNDLYNQLVYTYAGKDWSENIPMWGTATLAHITEGTWNVGEVTLKRAIAKVNVTVNEGKGLSGFEITEIRLHNYNTEGYCAPVGNDGPSVPATSRQLASNILTSGSRLTADNRNDFKDIFYIPEHRNTGVSEDLKVYLTIKATVNGSPKNYTLSFVENGETYDVLRNYMYVFNIISVKTEVDSELEYEVLSWNHETVEEPPFK